MYVTGSLVNDPATTDPYTHSLHDALPISLDLVEAIAEEKRRHSGGCFARADMPERRRPGRSEEHTSELQSPCNLVCLLLLDDYNITTTGNNHHTLTNECSCATHTSMLSMD